ncbi:PREDICTED: uteroglobin [Miniopterus natalensis]|uniref:uteroglobin n=1 Tax=Miniopterus natalensis TaxID=291302 RepID=UPI0007A6DC48|nr:PREDICTED: uteroglobin [Miniopterus natalensis]
MKAACPLALATLALCCSPGPASAAGRDSAEELPPWESAEICFDFIIKTFFVSTLSSYETSVEVFSPDADMKDVAIKIKGLVDTLPQQDRDNIRRAMDKIIKKPTLCLGFTS